MQSDGIYGSQDLRHFPSSRNGQSDPCAKLCQGNQRNLSDAWMIQKIVEKQNVISTFKLSFIWRSFIECMTGGKWPCNILLFIPAQGWILSRLFGRCVATFSKPWCLKLNSQPLSWMKNKTNSKDHLVKPKIWVRYNTRVNRIKVLFWLYDIVLVKAKFDKYYPGPYWTSRENSSDSW